MTNLELPNRLVVVRGALEGYWAAWAIERSRPSAATGESMCRFTSAFLVLILGNQWWVGGGEPYATGKAGGFFDGTTWHAHYWITDGEFIVDLTANQFGAPAIVFTSTEDSRYFENCTEFELAESLHHVQHRAQEWAKHFQDLHPNFTV